MTDMNGKVALITGAASGLGKAHIGQGRRAAQGALARHLPRFRAHAAGREADSRAGEGTGDQRGRGDSQRDAEGHRRCHLHHGGGHCPDRVVSGHLPVGRTDRSVDRGQPRLVHAITPLHQKNRRSGFSRDALSW
jgi:NAD(P)-dependent dehydrogenase (short-subunit alcohol dehydrogenase family)